ncbi:MAG: DNA polymerase III subunit delta' [Alcanivoracaceae bacterium]|nr:DNA polymerase III subunit delta' [Alcanivoracaceae bacterium]
MNTLPWLNDNIVQWQKIIAAKQVPHAILLSGSKGLGKIELAHRMAHIALCENLSANGVCYKCSGCLLIKVGNHTDLSVIRAEKSVIKVDQIRMLTKKVVLSSTRNQYRVIIIENAELMNMASANALLKTLEEPPGKVILILTTNDFGSILATIKSRCVKISVSPPSYDIAFGWLKNQSEQSNEDIQSSLILANAAPLVAIDLLQNNTLNTVREMLSDLNQLTKNTKSILDVSKHWCINELYFNLPYMGAYFFTMLKASLNINTLHNNFHLNLQSNYAHVKDLDSKILKFLSQINKFIKRSETALKTELLVEELLINWRNDFK